MMSNYNDKQGTATPEIMAAEYKGLFSKIQELAKAQKAETLDISSDADILKEILTQKIDDNAETTKTISDEIGTLLGANKVSDKVGFVKKILEKITDEQSKELYDKFNERDTSTQNINIKDFVDDVVNEIQKKSDNTPSSNQVENVFDAEIGMSFDSVSEGFRSETENVFNISDDGKTIEITDKDAAYAHAGDIAEKAYAEIEEADAQKIKLQEELNKTSDDDLEEQKRIRAEMELLTKKSQTAEKILSSVQGLDKTQMKSDQAGKINGATNKQEIKNQQKMAKASKETIGAFGRIVQGSTGFSTALSEANQAVGGLTDALGSAGGALGAHTSTLSSNFSGLQQTVLMTGGVLGMFLGAMTLATTAIKGFYEKLDIARDMGQGEEFVESLRGMELNTLLPPDQLKAMSETMSKNLGMSLTNNSKKMERLAIKQRMYERMNGKENAAQMLDSLDSLRHVLGSNSADGMMAELSAQTNSLAATLGISNKLALDQIKRLAENTEILTKGLDKDTAAEIQKVMKDEFAGLSKVYGQDAAERITKKAAEAISSKENVRNQANKMIQIKGLGGKGAEKIDETRKELHLSKKDVNALYARASTMDFKALTPEDQKLLEKLSVAMTEAENITVQDLQQRKKEINAKLKKDPQNKALQTELQGIQTKIHLASNIGLEGDQDVANALNTMSVKQINKMEKQGKVESAQRLVGNTAMIEINKLIGMQGPKNVKDSAKMLKALKETQIAKAAKDDPKKLEQYKNTKQSLLASKAQKMGIKDTDGKSSEELIKLLKEKKVTSAEIEKIDTTAFASTIGPALAKQIKDGRESGKGTTKIAGAKTIDNAKFKKADEDGTLAKNQTKGKSTQLENDHDKAARLVIEANQAMERGVMSLVNSVLPALHDALDWVKDNFQLIGAILGSVFAAKLLWMIKGPLGFLGKGIMGIANTIGGAAFTITKGIAKGILAAPKLIISGIKNGMSLLGKTFSIAGQGMKAAWKASSLMIKGGAKLANAGMSILKAPKKLWDGIKNGFSGFTDKASGLWDSVKSGAKGMWDTVSKGAKGMWQGISSKLQNIGGGATITKDSDGNDVVNETMFSKFEKDSDGNVKKDKSGKAIKKGLFSSVGEGLKGLVGPAALAGVALKAFQGGMEGWGKANKWFGNSLNDTGDALTKNTKYSENLAKSINVNAKWDEKKKQWVDENGEAIKSQGDLLKENTADGLKMAESLSKTGKAMWDGTKYVDDLGNAIVPSASLAQKSASAVGGALEALSFGMLDGNEMAHKTADAFSWIGKKMDELGLTETFSELGASLAAIGKVIMSVVGKIFNVLSPVFDVAVQVFSGIFKYIRGFFQILTGIFSGDLSKIGEGVKTIMSGFVDLILSPITLVTGFIDKIFGTDITTSVTNFGKYISDFFGGLVDFVMSPFESIKKLFAGFGVDIMKPIEAVSNYFSTIFDSAIKGAFSIWDGLTDMVTKPFDLIMGFIDGKFTFKEMVLGIFDSVINGVTNIFGGFIDIVTAPFKGILSFIDTMFGTNLLGSFSTVLGGLVDGVKGYFTSISDGVMNIVGGYWDIITSPFKRVMAWIDGELTLGQMVKGIFSDMVTGVTEIFTGFLDIITAPFKGIVTFIDSIFGTDLLGSFTLVKDNILGVFDGFIDLVTAPFKGLISWITTDMSFTDAMSQAWVDAKAALSKIWNSITDVIMIPVNKAIDYIKSLNPFADSKEDETTDKLQENATDDQKKLGADLYKKLGFETNMFGAQKEKSEKEISTMASGLSDKEIKALIASDTIDNTNIEQLAKILNDRNAGGGDVVVKPEKVEQHAEGGSTGGIGDKFASAITGLFTSDEKEVAGTVGPDEFVFSSDMIQGFLSKIKGSSNATQSVSPDIGKIPSSAEKVATVDNTVSTNIKNISTSTTKSSESDNKLTKENDETSDKTSIVTKTLNNVVTSTSDIFKSINKQTSKFINNMVDNLSSAVSSTDAITSTNSTNTMSVTKLKESQKSDDSSPKSIVTQMSDSVSGAANGSHGERLSISNGMNLGTTTVDKSKIDSMNIMNNAPKHSDAINNMVETKAKDAQKTAIKEQRKIADETVKKQTKDGIDDKQATTMVDALKSMAKKLNDATGGVAGKVVGGAAAVGGAYLGGGMDIGKSVVNGITGVLKGDMNISDALTNIGGTAKDALGNLGATVTNLLPGTIKDGIGKVGGMVNSALGAAGKVGGSIKDNVSGVLSGDVKPMDALKNVGQTIVGQLPGKITESLKSVTDKLGTTGASITTNLQGVLSGDTSIGDALKNVGGTVKEQLLGPLQQNLTGTFSKLTGEEGLGGVFNKFVGEEGLGGVFNKFTGEEGIGGAFTKLTGEEGLGGTLNKFASGGTGSLGKAFEAITGEGGSLGSAIGDIGKSLSGALGGLFGGGDKGGGVMDTVSSVGKSIGGFLGFNDGGRTPTKSDPLLERLTGMAGAAGVVHANELVVPSDVTNKLDKAISSNPVVAAGTSGVKAMGGVKSAATINSTKSSNSTTNSNNTTNNTTNVSGGGKQDPVVDKLTSIEATMKQVANHLGQRVQQGNKALKNDANAKTVQNVKDMKGSRSIH